MKDNYVITISRQFGSGGREIGQRLAKELGFVFYDKEIIAMSAQQSGIDEDVFKKEENRTSRAFYLLGTLSYTLGSPVSIDPAMSLHDQMFGIQSNVIVNIASGENAVIVGRCADQVLKGRDNVLSVYIHADEETRVKRASEEYRLASENMSDLVHKVDRERANYYHYYTGEKWGKVSNYDLCINTSHFSIDEAVALIKQAMKK